MQAKLARPAGQICLKLLRTECDSFSFFSPISWKKRHIYCCGNPIELKASALKYCRKSWITCNTAPSSINSVPKWWNMVTGGVSAPRMTHFHLNHRHLPYQRLHKTLARKRGLRGGRDPLLTLSLLWLADETQVNIPEPQLFKRIISPMTIFTWSCCEL